MDLRYWNKTIQTSHRQTRSLSTPFPHLLIQWRKSMLLSLQLRCQRHSRIKTTINRSRGSLIYNPAMIIEIALSIAGAALLTTINLHSSTARIARYQLVYGIRIGFGFGQLSYIVQTLLPEKDVPIGVTFITIVQNLSASIFVAVAQSIFQGEMHKRLEPLLQQSSNPSSILLSALLKILSSLPPETEETAKTAISDSIIRAFCVSLALSCVSVVGAFAIKWVPMQDPAKQDLVKQDKSSPEETTQNRREGVKENEKQGKKQDGNITAA
ncbi:putative major facilitator superfamily transporter protein [Botrytis fragariae]|uniref:Putative major facilitator superfamily transporter protein n=1 Tax=Botrytis fragariae TaxID=1964551 RepID=A0A8H6ALU9_9HELO|nr:putative major facilitator superfamily transporter protein [Botrytis fragariae]KAF5869650.1 putative major facilitator superfamily transporter protein [Botrytis fragariae]